MSIGIEGCVIRLVFCADLDGVEAPRVSLGFTPRKQFLARHTSSEYYLTENANNYGSDLDPDQYLADPEAK
jgi:hypothetical protein